MTPVYKALLLNEPMMHDRPSCESRSPPRLGALSTEELQSSYGVTTEVAEPLKLAVAEASSDGQLQPVVAGVRRVGDQAQAIDDRYRALLLDEQVRPDVPWWESRYPRYAGQQLTAALLSLYGLTIEFRD